MGKFISFHGRRIFLNSRVLHFLSWSRLCIESAKFVQIFCTIRTNERIVNHSLLHKFGVFMMNYTADIVLLPKKVCFLIIMHWISVTFTALEALVLSFRCCMVVMHWISATFTALEALVLCLRTLVTRYYALNRCNIPCYWGFVLSFRCCMVFPILLCAVQNFAKCSLGCAPSLLWVHSRVAALFISSSESMCVSKPHG